jgi:hypothetical protein
MDLTRSEFLRLFAGTGVGALGLSTLDACGDSKDKVPDAPPITPDAPPIDAPMIDGPPASCTARDPKTVIGSNHGHAFAMAVTKEDVMAGQMMPYNIKGVSDHPHTVTITAAMFAMLQQNMPITVMSTTDGASPGHAHMVTVSCV